MFNWELFEEVSKLVQVHSSHDSSEEYSYVSIMLDISKQEHDHGAVEYIKSSLIHHGNSSFVNVLEHENGFHLTFSIDKSLSVVLGRISKQGYAIKRATLYMAESWEQLI